MESKQEKINELARKLKDMHLASSHEEAMARAREIIESSEDNSETIGSMANDIIADTKSDVADHKSEESDIKDMKSDLKALKEAVDDIQHLVDQAKKAKKE